jgi:uncharacterized protein (TIRG00374 family)
MHPTRRAPQRGRGARRSPAASAAVSRVKILIGVVISAGLFAALLWRVDLRELGRELGRTSWGWTLTGAVLAVVGLWVRARRWRYLFPPGSPPPGLLPAVMIGYMVNNILPLRAGEIVRVYVVARRWGHGFWTTLATLIVERVLDSLAIILVLATLMLLVPVPPIFQWTAGVLLVLDVAAVAALVVVAAAPRRAQRRLERRLARWPRLASRVQRGITTFVRGLDGVRTPGHAIPLLLWTIGVWLAPALAAWTMFQAAHLALPLTAGWTVLAFVGLGVSVPSAPGYIGVFHYAAVLALDIFGVPRAAGVGYAILFHATQVIPVTIAGWIFLLREHMSLGEATHVRAPAEGAATDQPA